MKSKSTWVPPVHAPRLLINADAIQLVESVQNTCADVSRPAFQCSHIRSMRCSIIVQASSCMQAPAAAPAS